MKKAKTCLAIAVAIATSSSMWAMAFDAPIWPAGLDGSTSEEWRFDTDANPADPEVVDNPYGSPGGTPVAAIAPGSFGEGWFDAIPAIYGSRQGSWDLGSAGTITITIPNDPTPLGYKEIWVHVTYWQDIRVAPAVTVTDGAPYGDPIDPVLVEEAPMGPGAWYCSLTKWRIIPNPLSETIILTGDLNWGSLVDEVFIETYATEVALTVESTPVTGVSITGTKPDTTNYVAPCDVQEVVNLTAPMNATVGELEFRFLRWVVDGVEGPACQTGVQITMDISHTAEARYSLFGDVTGDCRVNVLDFIGVRNHMYDNVATGDNCRYDLTGDGVINILDMIAVRNNVRNHCPE